MKWKRTLRRPAVLTAALLLIAAGGRLEAAKLLGLTGPTVDGGDTSKIIAFDTALGTSTVLADTGLTRATGGSNGPSGPNGLAYDGATGTAYFSSVPADGSLPILYSVAVDPQPAGAVVALGNPSGARLVDATFFDGKYYYIDGATDDLHEVTFLPGGAIAADTVIADLLNNTSGLGFGDVSVDKDGVLYGSALKISTNRVIFFSVDLDPLSANYLVYTEHGPDLDPVTDPVMQLSFGGEGTLLGHTGALSSFNDLYYVSLVPATLGARGKVLDDIDGGPLTDLSSFNPLCDCPRADDDDDGGGGGGRQRQRRE